MVLGVISMPVCRQVTLLTDAATLLSVLILINAVMKAELWRCGRASPAIGTEVRQEQHRAGGNEGEFEPSRVRGWRGERRRRTRST